MFLAETVTVETTRHRNAVSATHSLESQFGGTMQYANYEIVMDAVSVQGHALIVIVYAVRLGTESTTVTP